MAQTRTEMIVDKDWEDMRILNWTKIMNKTWCKI